MSCLLVGCVAKDGGSLLVSDAAKLFPNVMLLKEYSACELMIVLVFLQRQCSPIGWLLEAPMYSGGVWQCGGAK